VSSEAAALVTESLLQADIRGVATHGSVRLPSYCHEVRDGVVDAQAEPVILADRGGAAVFVDGRHAFGAVTATFCLDLAVERALAGGVGSISARHCAHFGAAAHYALRGAERGCVTIVVSNTPAVMAPYGGGEPAIGNNPFAVAAPMPQGRPAFVLDMAQSVVARGRIKLAEMGARRSRRAGRSIRGAARPPTRPRRLPAHCLRSGATRDPVSPLWSRS
jgi:LDH2 family malate/lactate/ureidoglycolate dehydrogenase